MATWKYSNKKQGILTAITSHTRLQRFLSYSKIKFWCTSIKYLHGNKKLSFPAVAGAKMAVFQCLKHDFATDSLDVDSQDSQEY